MRKCSCAAYHRSRSGHYFRVPKPKFYKTLEDFVRTITQIPTYDEIKFGTCKNSPLPEVNELFRIQIDDKSFDGDRTGNRTRIVRMRT